MKKATHRRTRTKLGKQTESGTLVRTENYSLLMVTTREEDIEGEREYALRWQSVANVIST
jgi:hypothetical protein